MTTQNTIKGKTYICFAQAQTNLDDLLTILRKIEFHVSTIHQANCAKKKNSDPYIRLVLYIHPLLFSINLDFLNVLYDKGVEVLKLAMTTHLFGRLDSG